MPVLRHPPRPRQPHPGPGRGAPHHGAHQLCVQGETKTWRVNAEPAERGCRPTGRALTHAARCWRRQGRRASRAARALPGGRPVPASRLLSVHLLSALLSRPPSSGAVGRKEGFRARLPGLCRCCCLAPPPPPGGAASLLSPGPTRSDTPIRPLLPVDRAFHQLYVFLCPPVPGTLPGSARVSSGRRRGPDCWRPPATPLPADGFTAA